METLQQNLCLLLMCIFQLVLLSYAKDEDLKCGVCRAVIGEINLSIRSADPKKKVKVGSFRVDSKGNQATVDIPLGRSESYIGEQFEKLCDRMHGWGVLVEKGTGRRAVIRKYNMEGSLIDGLDKDAQTKLTKLCHDFVEDHEEESIPIFQVEGSSNEEHEKALCIEMLGLCTEEEIKYQSGAQSKGIRDAIMSQAQAGKDTLNISPGGGAADAGAEDDGDDDDEDDDDDIKEDAKDEKKKDTEEERKMEDEIENDEKKDEL